MSGRAALRKWFPVAVLVLFVLGGVFVVRNLGVWLSRPDRFSNVDVLVVTDGEPDVRVPRALALIRRGLADQAWVIPSGEGPVLHEGKSIREFATANGAAGKMRVLAPRSRSLRRDAAIVAARLGAAKHPARRIAVIAAPIEVARTRLIFEHAANHNVLVWSDGTRYRATRWWKRDRVATILEAGKYLGALAVAGPSARRLPAEVPASLPLKALVGGFLVALLVGAVCRPLARRLGLVAEPRLWRVHTTPTPMLGGLALIVGLGGGIVAAGGLRVSGLSVAAGAGVVAVAVVGLVDDIAGLGASVRLLWAGGAGAVAWLLGLRAHVAAPGSAAADVANLAVTILWFVGVTFAMNNFDNIDGAVAGVAAASAGALSVAAALGGQFVVAVAAAALAGACIGFLVHNAAPARLFMGDMGALGVGFALAALALALEPRPGPPLSMAVPIIVLGIPLFDTTLVVVHRLRSGRSPSVGGTDHSSHRLLTRGLSVRQAVAFLWAAQAALGALAILVARSRPAVGWPVLALIAVGGTVSLVYFLRLQPWKPPWQLQATETVVEAVHRAMRSLRELEEAVGDEAWRLSDPRAARSTQETLKRLERVRRLIEARPQEPES